MERWLIILLMVCGFSSARAQEGYFGVGTALFTNFSGGFSVFPTLAFQGGCLIANDLELRATLDTVFIGSDLGVDLLYTFEIPNASLKGYIGGGPDLFFVFFGGGAFGLHGTFGVETVSASTRFFAEVQPIYTSNLFTEGGGVVLKVRTGVNLPF